VSLRLWEYDVLDDDDDDDVWMERKSLDLLEAVKLMYSTCLLSFLMCLLGYWSLIWLVMVWMMAFVTEQ